MTQETQKPALLRRVDGLLTAAVNDELLMMDTTQGKYFSLKGVGARIWELLAAPISVDALVTALTDEYEVEADTARQQAETFVTALRQRGLVISTDAGSV